jgi:redox-sensitive bicupin YhaK (pirin superfamily)
MTDEIANLELKEPRRVERVIAGREVRDGDGVRINRILTQDLQRRLDPFLMLDLFGSDQPDDYSGGFPDHPHRGFETVTFMLEGRMRHRDSAGHEGLLVSGGVQWMTAGRGVIHSEMPEQEDGLMEGFQLWLNLPAKDKLMAPWYRDFAAAELPAFTTTDGVRVTVIAGQSHGVCGAVEREATEVLYLDIDLPAGTSFVQPLPVTHSAFVCVYRGKVGAGEPTKQQGGRAKDALLAVANGGTALAPRQMAILANAGDGVMLSSETGGKAILVAGRPLGESIAQYGPFVMNTQAEIHQAIADFRAGALADQNVKN